MTRKRDADRDARADRPEIRHPGRVHAALPADHGRPGVVAGDPQEDQHRGEVEEDVEEEVRARLTLHRPVAVEEIRADVHALGKRIGGSQHEMGAVGHAARVVGPDGGSDEVVARDDLVDHGEHQRQDQPAHDLAGPQAQRVDSGDGVRHPRRHVRRQLPGRTCPALGKRRVEEFRSTGHEPGSGDAIFVAGKAELPREMERDPSPLHPQARCGGVPTSSAT